MGDLSTHFSSTEFACKCAARGFAGEGYCGGKSHVDQALITVLEDVISAFSVATSRPVCKITSGYRCELYNKQVGGAPRSQHCQGIAADIQLYHGQAQIAPEVVSEYLDRKYPDTYGIGTYRRWTHIDVRGNKARWTG
jgi:uncharacterized protein YcbK (DUF882 family)